MDDLHAHTPSPTARPRSMMVGTEDGHEIKYTTIAFQDDVPTNPPPARRNTKYSDIRPQPMARHTSKEGSGAGAEKDLVDNGRVSPSYVGMGVCQSHPLPPDVRGDNPTYDTPPPPVPLRFESQEEATGGGIAVGGEAANLDLSAASKFPFKEDPFGDGQSGNAWDDPDPSAFYDRPRSGDTPADTQQQQQTLEDGYLEIGQVIINNSTSDFTGDSAYEDTSKFLEDIRSRYKNKNPDEVLGAAGGLGGTSRVRGGAGEDEDECAYDLPPVEMVDGMLKKEQQQCDQDNEEEGQGDSYDFPTELSRYPFKDRGGGEGSKDEPSLHTMQYPSQQEQQPPHPQGRVPGGTGKSDSTEQHGLRHNVPLPPTPDEQGASGVSGLPPLPTRPGGTAGAGTGGKGAGGKGAGGTAVAGPGPGGKAPSSRDGPLPPLPPSNDRPRLPPFNHPWGNKKPMGIPAPSSASAPSSAPHGDFPPLPPRKKNPNGVESGAVHPSFAQQPPQDSFDDPALADLLNRGYQRADVERALRIARNDYEMAKSILQEFGGRQ